MLFTYLMNKYFFVKLKCPFRVQLCLSLCVSVSGYEEELWNKIYLMTEYNILTV